MDASRLIRQARLQGGLSQSEVAWRLGTSQSAIARWESGQVSPRLDTLEKLVRACGFEIDLHLRAAEEDRDQLLERLSWTPRQRLEALLDLLAFEEKARRGRPVAGGGPGKAS